MSYIEVTHMDDSISNFEVGNNNEHAYDHWKKTREGLVFKHRSDGLPWTVVPYVNIKLYHLVVT